MAAACFLLAAQGSSGQGANAKLPKLRNLEAMKSLSMYPLHDLEWPRCSAPTVSSLSSKMVGLSLVTVTPPYSSLRTLYRASTCVSAFLSAIQQGLIETAG